MHEDFSGPGVIFCPVSLGAWKSLVHSVTTELTEGPMTLKPKHEKVFLAEILIPW